MSGICGKVNFDGGTVDESHLNAMLAAARHRGPDGCHRLVRDHFGLGFLSLEITPESLGEIQPVFHEPSGIGVVADIRLDNRDELFGALRGEVTEILRSDRPPTDAELVLAARLKWSGAFADRLIGDFAIAVYDARNRVLQLVRDPMGLRSLSYRIDKNRVFFGSEIKQILALPGVPKRINEAAVGIHLAGVFPPPEVSYYQGVENVVPGEILTIRKGTLKRKRFWEYAADTPTRREKESDLAEAFREIFLEAVRCRLRCAKPAGISLSGGIDSGTVASAFGWMRANKKIADPPEFRAYSWAFSEPELAGCDERSISGEVAARYGIPVTEVFGDTAWPLADLDRNRPDFDEPYIDYYHDLTRGVIEQAKSRNAALLIVAERGDMMNDHWVYDYPGLLRSGNLRALFAELSGHGKATGTSISRMVRRFLVKPMLESADLSKSVQTTIPIRIPDYIPPDFAQRAGIAALAERRFPHSALPDPARRLRYQLIFSSGTGRRISMYERSMASLGIGFADPWSDRRVAEFVISLPQHQVHRFLDFKRLARNSLSTMLPDSLRHFSHSTAKANPTALFNRGVYDRASGAVRELIAESRAAAHGFVDKRVLSENFERVLQGDPEPYDPWWFITLELWLRTHWE